MNSDEVAGVRPSPGAACLGGDSALDRSTVLPTSRLAAPGDGRAPISEDGRAPALAMFRLTFNSPNLAAWAKVDGGVHFSGGTAFHGGNSRWPIALAALSVSNALCATPFHSALAGA